MRRMRATTFSWRSGGSAGSELLHSLADRPLHCFRARHLWTPAQLFHAARVEADLRHVAGPAARAAGVLELHALRIEAHRLDRPLRDLVHRRRIGNGEVVAIHQLAPVLMAEHHY